MECKKVSFPVWPAKPDCNVVYSCSEAPEPSHATAHAITLNITAWDLELLFGSARIKRREREKKNPASRFWSHITSPQSLSESVIILLMQYWFENMDLFCFGFFNWNHRPERSPFLHLPVTNLLNLYIRLSFIYILSVAINVVSLFAEAPSKQQWQPPPPPKKPPY